MIATLAHATPPRSAAVGALTAVVGLESIEKNRWRWTVILAAMLTAMMVAGLARELFGEGMGALSRAFPTNPLFYLSLAVLYISPSGFDWLIFRKLWHIPAAGLGALMKRRITNDVLPGYSGEVYFYAWARGRMKMVAAPFGTVKDVSILSAIAGNAITLAMMAVALPFAIDLLTPGQFRTVIGSAALTFGMSLPFLLFPKRVFSLPRRTLWWVFGMHCLRLVVGSTVIALAWHFAMPDVSIGMWLLLAAARLLVSRVPLVLNKDLLFGNFTIILIGQGQALSEMIALTSALTLLAHGAIIGALGLFAATGARR